MLVKEKFEDVFTLLNDDEEILVLDFFEPSNMDNIYIFKYGNRELNSKAEETEKETIVQIIKDLFIKKWNNEFLTITESLEEMKDYSEKIIESVSDEGSLNLNRNSLNKISAYNTEDFVNNSNDENEETTTTTNIKTREYEIKKLKSMNYYNSLLSYLNRTNIYDTMMLDVNSIISKIIF